jgi:outer membrane receptor for ferrienterochelin and colicins
MILKHFRYSCCFLCLSLVFHPFSLRAGTPLDLTTLSLEDLMKIPVHGASKFDQKTSDAPAAVTIVTADDIQKFGYRTLADLLRSVRGINVSYDRNYSYAGLRGFSSTGDYNSRFLVQIDGHRVNENIYNQALIGTEFILDMDLVDKVEIIRGTGASLYGSNAFFGVINIITKNSGKFGQPEIAGSYGSYDSFKGRVSYGRQLDNGLDLALSGTDYFSKGQNLYYSEFDNSTTPGGIARNSDDDKSGTLFGRMKYGPLTLEGAWVSRDKTIPTGAFGTDFNNPNTFTADKIWYLDLKYHQTVFKNTEITARLFFDEYQYKGNYSSAGRINEDTALGQALGSELIVSRPFFDGTHRLTAGAEFVDNITQNQKNEDLDPYGLNLDSTESSQKWSIFAQDEYRMTSWLRINAGLCLDHSSNYDSLLNPRLAFIIQPQDSTTVKLIYGTALRPPNAYELYYEDGTTSKRPLSLDPEKITTYEAILEQRLFSNYRMSVGAFSYEIDDMIRQVNDSETNLLVFQNSGQMTAKGFELELEGVWRAGLRGNIGYTFQNAKDKDTGETPVNSPQHIGKANLIVPLFSDNWSLGTNLQYLSPRKTNEGSDTDAVWIINMTLLGKNVRPGLTLSLSAYNLLNQKYKDPVGLEFLQRGGIEQDGMSFLLKMVFSY